MPYKNIETRRAYQKAWKRRKRAKVKERKREIEAKKIEQHIRAWDLNYGIKTEKPKFKSYKVWKIKNPNKSFKDYLKEKREFDFENRDYGEPLKIPEGLTNYSERAYGWATNSLETKRCRELREALRNCKSRKHAMLLEDLIKEDC